MSDGQPRMVCYVTRDELAPTLMIQFLADRGWGTIWCGDGGQAARWIADQRADIVIIDTRADKDLRLAALLLADPEMNEAEVVMVDGERIARAGRHGLN